MKQGTQQVELWTRELDSLNKSESNIKKFRLLFNN